MSLFKVWQNKCFGTHWQLSSSQTGAEISSTCSSGATATDVMELTVYAHVTTRGSWSISDVTWCLDLLLWESNHQLRHFLWCVCVSELRTLRILWTSETCLMSLPEKLLCGEQTRRAAAGDYFRWRVYMGLLGQAVRVCKSVSCVWQYSGAHIAGQSLLPGE